MKAQSEREVSLGEPHVVREGSRSARLVQHIKPRQLSPPTTNGRTVSSYHNSSINHLTSLPPGALLCPPISAPTTWPLKLVLPLLSHPQDAITY